MKPAVVNSDTSLSKAVNEPWQEYSTLQQRKLLNAACGDLAKCLQWHGFKLSKDDWRHFLAATVYGWRLLPGIDIGEGAPGFVMLARSSLDLSKDQCTKAIHLAFALGDAPWEYDPTQTKAVRWCDVVELARGFNPNDFRTKEDV